MSNVKVPPESEWAEWDADELAALLTQTRTLPSLGAAWLAISLVVDGVGDVIDLGDLFGDDDPPLPIKGGPGSGHRKHKGRPGQRGGSLPSDGVASASADIPKGVKQPKTVLEIMEYEEGAPFPPDQYARLMEDLADRPEKLKTHLGDKPIGSVAAINKMRENWYQRKNTERWKDGIVKMQGSDPDPDDKWGGMLWIPMTPEQIAYIDQRVESAKQARVEDLVAAHGLPTTYDELEKTLGVSAKDRLYAEKNLWSGSERNPESLRVMNEQDAKMAQFAHAFYERVGWRTIDEDERNLLHSYYADQVRLPDGEDDGRSWIVMRFDRALEAESNARMRHALAMGEITPEEASVFGRFAAQANGGSSKWEPLPPVLYHTATNAGAILNDKLRSRRELNMRSGVGLGGGEDDTISFSEDEAICKGIERSLHEAWLVASGKLTVHDMLEAANEGLGVGKSFGARFMSFQGSGSTRGYWTYEVVDRGVDLEKDFDHLSAEMQYALRAENGEFGDTFTIPYSFMEKKTHNTQEWLDETRWTIWKAFAAARENAGGLLDPLFFSTDWKALAKLDPAQFKTLVVRPKSGTRGYKVSALGEWRTTTGDVVEQMEAVNYYDPDDRMAILRGDR